MVAFDLYCRLPFGRLHSKNPEIIEYANLMGRTPSALAMKLTNIASLDPAITATGRTGLTGASLADKSMWIEMQSNWGEFALESHRAVMHLLKSGDSATARHRENDVPLHEMDDYTGVSETRQTQVRIGQSFFRKAVLSSYGYECCITGLSVPRLLVASHIVPWKTNVENRLNPKNGLCLSALHDKAFDNGIITISDDFTVRVSRKMKTDNDEFYNSALLRYDGEPISLPKKFRPDSGFLAFHRENVFEQWRDD